MSLDTRRLAFVVLWALRGLTARTGIFGVCFNGLIVFEDRLIFIVRAYSSFLFFLELALQALNCETLWKNSKTHII